jgi:hypothetical protein
MTTCGLPRDARQGQRGRSQSVITILPWTWRPDRRVTASPVCSIGNVAAIGTVILLAGIASVI